MNETLELWSAPWHSLQRTLADTLGLEIPRIVAVVPMARGAHRNPVSASSWLARARTPIQSAAWRGP